MRLTVRLEHAADAALSQRLDWLYAQTERLHLQNAHILQNQEIAMSTIKELVADVAAVRGAAASVGALITQLREQITGLTNGNLPADVQAQVDQAFADAEAAKSDLAAAIAAPGSSTAPANPAPAAPSTGP